MSLVRLEGVAREIGTFVILDRIDAAIAPGERVGLVGPNGAGKTTLLRIVSGRDEADRGTVTRRRGLSLGLLSQEAHFDEAFMAAPDLRAAVRHGAAHLETMAAELERLEHGGHAAGARYADLQHRYEILGGYTLDQRVDEALSGLGFARDEWLRPPTAVSGGQQTRAALARLVVANPDLLMLDEPTNHLDINAIEWLEEHLRRRAGALLVASHDRAFLDATVTRVWELRDRRLTVFRGDYSAYHRQRVERDLRAEKEADTQAGAIEREVELVQRYRSQRKHTKMHEHEARLERLKADKVEAPRKSRRTLRIHGAALAGGPVRSGELVVRLEDFAVGYLPGRGALAPDGSEAAEPVTVATAPFLAAQRGDRIGIVGPNGAGKTTLLRTIAGDLPPLDGMIAFGHQVQPGYLAQLRDAAIPGATVLDAIMEAIPLTPGEARGYLARFLFRGDDAFKEVRSLSGGERSRLELALLGILPSNLLLLDEPTNHLDIAAREAIEAFLADSSATLLVVSHDRRLLETICERLWVVGDGLAVPFDGGYRAWRAAVGEGWTIQAEAERRRNRLRPGAPGTKPLAVVAGSASGSSRSSGSGGGGDGAGATRTGNAAAARRAGVARRAAEQAGVETASPHATADEAAAAARTIRPRTRPKLSKDAYRRRREALDAELSRLGLRKSQLELAMGQPSVSANFVEMRRVTSELADVDRALGEAEDAWLELEELAP
jgi:ATP-binding cassette, subfamily F, member 3